MQQLGWFEMVCVGVLLVLGMIVALSPGVTYEPTPRVVLYVLISALTGLLFARGVSAKFEMKLPAFVFTTGGTAAVVLGTVVILTHLSEPVGRLRDRVGLYRVVDQGNRDVPVDWSGALTIRPLGVDEPLAPYVRGNEFVVIFPKQGESVAVQVKRPNGDLYAGEVVYDGTKATELKLGDELSLLGG